MLSQKIDLIRDIEILQGRESKYLILDDNMYHCNKEFEKTILKLIEIWLFVKEENALQK